MALKLVTLLFGFRILAQLSFPKCFQRIQWQFHCETVIIQSCIETRMTNLCPIWSLPMMHWTSLYLYSPSHCNWHLVVITGDLFKLVHLRTYPYQYWHLVVVTEAHTVGKRALRILLEYFLVLTCSGGGSGCRCGRCCGGGHEINTFQASRIITPCVRCKYFVVVETQCLRFYQK